MYIKSLYITVELKPEQLHVNSVTKYAQPATWQSIYKEKLMVYVEQHKPIHLITKAKSLLG